MSTYNAIVPEIDIAETARYAGLKSNAGFPAELIRKACSEARLLISPKGSWEIYDYDNKENTVKSTPPFLISGQSICHHLRECGKVAVFAVTIGADLEKKALSLFEAGEYTAGLLLDAAGTTAVETIADKLNELIASQAAKEGLKATWRYSPGYGDWPVTVQQDIVRLANGKSAGITVTPSSILIPRKSVTAIIGWYSKNHASADLSHCGRLSCEQCQQQNCIARKEPSQ